MAMASPNTLWQVGRPRREIVIVQSGKIIMDQGVGVQHLERGAQFFDSLRKRTRNHASGFHAKNRTQPFAAGKNTVPHRLMD